MPLAAVNQKSFCIDESSISCGHIEFQQDNGSITSVLSLFTIHLFQKISSGVRLRTDLFISTARAP